MKIKGQAAANDIQRRRGTEIEVTIVGIETLIIESIAGGIGKAVAMVVVIESVVGRERGTGITDGTVTDQGKEVVEVGRMTKVTEVTENRTSMTEKVKIGAIDVNHTGGKGAILTTDIEATGNPAIVEMTEEIEGKTIEAVGEMMKIKWTKKTL